MSYILGLRRLGRRLDSRFGGAVAGRVGWTLFDQVVSSGTNFVINIAAAKSLSGGEFGAFGIAFASYILGLGVVRSICTDPLVVRHSGVADHRTRRFLAMALGGTVAIGFGLSMVVLGFSAIASPLVRSALTSLALVFPLLLVQDSVRFLFFAQGTPRRAALNDGLWALFQIVFLIIVFNSSMSPLPMLILIWGGSAGLAALIGLLQCRIVPRPHLFLQWWRLHRDLSGRYFAEFAAVTGTTQLVTMSLGTIAGLSAVAALRGAQVVMGPINILLVGFNTAALRELICVRRMEPNRLRSIAKSASALATGVAGTLSALVVFFPPSLGEAILGKTWHEARPMIPIVALGMVASAWSVGPLAGLRALEASTHSLSARLRIAPLTMVGGMGGALSGGAMGASIGLSAASLAGIWIWWKNFMDAWKKEIRSVTDDREAPGEGEPKLNPLHDGISTP